MSKELSKPVMNKSRLRNKYLKKPPRENFLAYKVEIKIVSAPSSYNLSTSCTNIFEKKKKNQFLK